jgi:hypothetical protein
MGVAQGPIVTQTHHRANQAGHRDGQVWRGHIGVTQVAVPVAVGDQGHAKGGFDLAGRPGHVQEQAIGIGTHNAQAMGA